MNATTGKRTLAPRAKILFWIMVFLYCIGLLFFYLKYVPFIKPFQAVLLFLVGTVCTLTIKKLEWGILAFIFYFPLINNLPYFFKIYEPIPHAPAALVLFLFFFLGWLIYTGINNSKLQWTTPILKPMGLFALLVIISAVITFLRYSNFFPFISGNIYELIVNVEGVTAGGAFMSIVLFSLNYLSGFIFFFILINAVKSKSFIRQIIFTLCLSFTLSLCFGLIQHFVNLKLGNNPISVNEGMINATFKDALAFGAFIALIVPLVLGKLLSAHGKQKIPYLIIAIFAGYLIFHSGSRSGLLCLGLGVLLVLGAWIKALFNARNKKPLYEKKKSWPAYIGIFIVAAILSLGLIGLREDISQSRTISRTIKLTKQGTTGLVSSQRMSLWKISAGIIRDYPFTGIGIGSFIIEVSNFSQMFDIPIQCSESADNYFLQIVSELGILGLILILWIFWVIFIRIKRSFSRFSNQGKDRYVLLGVVVGVFALLLNYQFHSYIGSFEVKYGFWLLVAVVFCWDREDHRKKDAAKISRAKFSGVIFAFLLFGFMLLWNSSRSLSLSTRTDQLGLEPKFGLYEAEFRDDGGIFYWTREYGGFPIAINKPYIVIPIHAAHPNIGKDPVKVKIFLIKDFFKQKVKLGEIILTDTDWQTYVFDVSEEVDKEVILLMEVSRTWIPIKIKGTPDPRNLGVAVGEIKLTDNKDIF